MRAPRPHRRRSRRLRRPSRRCRRCRVSTNGDLKMWALFRLSLFRQHKNRYSAPLIRMSPRASSFSSQDSPRQYKRTEHSSTHGAQPHRVRHAVRFQTRRGSLTCVHASSSASMLHTCSVCHYALRCWRKEQSPTNVVVRTCSERASGVSKSVARLGTGLRGSVRTVTVRERIPTDCERACGPATAVTSHHAPHGANESRCLKGCPSRTHLPSTSADAPACAGPWPRPAQRTRASPLACARSNEAKYDVISYFSYLMV